MEEGWFNEQRSASLGDGIKDTYSLEFKGGGVFILRQLLTIWMTIHDNSKGYFVWVERATRRWQPKTK